MTPRELIEKLMKIKNKGFIKTHRAHDTGIGKTLEDLLEIRENNFVTPDYGEVELKAKRIDSGSMLTLATKTPKPKGINRLLFEKYKYLDSKGYWNLHTTVYGSRFNPQGFKLRFDGERLFLDNRPHNINAYWDETLFRDVLASKSNTVLLVFANSKGAKKTLDEYFHYTEAYLLHQLNPDKFKNAIENDYLKVDIRIGVYRTGPKKGQYHDHGTGFRMMKDHFLLLYDSYTKVL